MHFLVKSNICFYLSGGFGCYVAAGRRGYFVMKYAWMFLMVVTFQFGYLLSFTDIWSSCRDFRFQILPRWSCGFNIWHLWAETCCWELDSGFHYGHLSHKISPYEVETSLTSFITCYITLAPLVSSVKINLFLRPLVISHLFCRKSDEDASKFDSMFSF